MEDILHLYELKFPITLYHMSLSYTTNMIWQTSAVGLYLAASQLPTGTIALLYPPFFIDDSGAEFHTGRWEGQA